MTKPITTSNARKLLRAWHQDKCRLEGASSRLSLVQNVRPWGSWVRTCHPSRWIHVSIYRYHPDFPGEEAKRELIDTHAVRVDTYRGTVEEG